MDVFGHLAENYLVHLFENLRSLFPYWVENRMSRLVNRVFGRIRSLFFSKDERRHSLVGPPELWKMKRDFQIAFLKSVNMRPHHYLIDIGCGTLRGGKPLIEYLEAGHYFGIDSRDEAIQQGRLELTESGLDSKNPTIAWVKDISTLDFKKQFEFIWSFSVLIHMTDEILNKTMEFVGRHLATDGVFYANVNIGERKEGNWQGFPVVSRSQEFYKSVCDKYGLKLEDVGSLKQLGHISNNESQDSQRMLRISKK